VRNGLPPALAMCMLPCDGHTLFALKAEYASLRRWEERHEKAPLHARVCALRASIPRCPATSAMPVLPSYEDIMETEGRMATSSFDVFAISLHEDITFSAH